MNDQNEDDIHAKPAGHRAEAPAYVRSSDVLSRRVGEEVIVAATTGDPHVLAGTALTIWNALTTPRTVPELVDEVSAAYGANPDTVGPDVHAFVSDLVSRGLARQAVDGDS